MLGDGSNSDGTVFWGRREPTFRGIAVFFAWVSVHENRLRSFVDLYSSLGWNSLVSRAHFLDAFYPERATSIAFFLVNELVEELKIKPCPVVFVAFSGGPKACMYKAFQIILETCDGHLTADESRLVRHCLAGHIYDSGPIDFTSDFCARFGLHPTIQKIPGPLKIVSWIAKGVASGLDGLCLTRFECQRSEFWHTLYSSIDLGAPFLFLCSENDEYAPLQVIFNFTQRIQELGGDIELVTWNGSPHIGHYKHYPIQYRAAVTSLLEKAMSVYSRRVRQPGEGAGIEGMHDEISELICDLQKVAVNSNRSLRRVAVGPSDHFFLPSSAEHHNGQDSRSLHDEGNERSIYMPSPPRINAHSVLGQILFDVCVPKNVEGWDIRFSSSANRLPFASSRRNLPSRGFKCNRRSKL
ncbi:uncharacterized protein LOC123227717 [Mangifera indica]|uniref:uncharacterized protein LOC123227717 n=1 Tax=Mangifera indica TaxID=29780 RepID=UPI001CFB4A73|nr:uncharacterized protein LOC123227717 [Mangifera indica]